MMPTDIPDEVRRPRWGRRIAAVGVLVLLVSPWWGPPLFRRMDFFRVRHVEVRDARFTPPGEVRELLRIDTTFSIWDDLDSLEARVAAHPQVKSVRISRRFPSTLVVRLDEHMPVALVQQKDGLHAYDATGRALPLDPSRTPVDAPILVRADTGILRFLGDLQGAVRDVYARLNEVRRAGPDELMLDLMTVTVRIRPDIGVERLALISFVEAELAKRRARVRELDFRFRDQVIARLQ